MLLCKEQPSKPGFFSVGQDCCGVMNGLGRVRKGWWLFFGGGFVSVWAIFAVSSNTRR